MKKIKALLSILSLGFLTSSWAVGTKPVEVREESGNISNSSSFLEQNLRDYEQYYINSKKCQKSCSSIKSMVVNKYDDKTNLLELEFGIWADRKSFVTLPINLSDFEVISLTNNNELSSSIKENEVLNVFVEKSGTLNLVLKRKNNNSRILLNQYVFDFKNLSNSKISLNQQQGQFVLNFEEKEIPKETKEPVIELKKKSFYLLERAIVLDEKWKMVTVLRPLNVGNTNQNISFEIPLLNGEKVLKNELELNEKVIKINIKDGESLRWDSELNPNKNLLVKTTKDNYLQSLSVYSKESWEIESKKMKPISVSKDNQFKSGFSWMVWPGEEIDINLYLYEYNKGQINALSDLELNVNMNASPIKYNLSGNINSSIGGIYKLKIEDEKLKINKINVNQKDIEPELNVKRELLLPLNPGKNQIVIDMTSNESFDFFWKAPTFKFEGDLVNYQVKVNHVKKWILATGGADIKPSILLWSVLITLLLFAFIISKTTLVDIGIGSMILLLFGISQQGYDLALITIAWFAWIKWRSNKKKEDFKKYWVFNLIQVSFVFVSLSVFSGIISSVTRGLIYLPEIFIAGVQSTNNSLFWYSQNYSSDQPWIFMLPIFIYRILMMAWAIWLAFNLLKWVKMAWESFSHDGFWMSKPKKQMIEVNDEDQNLESSDKPKED